MNTISKWMLGVAMAATLAMPVFAQTPAPNGQPPAQVDEKHHEHGRHHGGMRLFKGLNLSDEQKAQLKSVMDGQRNQMKANHDAFKQELDSVLTPDQKARLAQMKAERGQHKGQHQRPDLKTALGLTPDQASKLDALKSQHQHLSKDQFAQALNLTPDQQAKWQALRGQHQKGHNGFAQALNLTPAQQQQLKAWRDARKPQMEAQRQAFVANVDNILNADQKAQFHRNLDEMKSHHMDHPKTQG